MRIKAHQIIATVGLGTGVILTGCTPSLPGDYLVDPSHTSPATGCTEIGAESAITVHVSPSEIEHTRQITVTACTDDHRCAVAHRTADQLRRDTVDDDTYISILWPYHDDHATVNIEHVIADTVIVTDTELTLTTYSPNGPDCEPHVLQAELDL